MAATATPPLPPDVTSQQEGSPLGQYAQGAQQQQAQQPPQKTGVDLIEQLFNEVAEKLNQIAKVSSMVDPSFIEYIKKMAQVGGEAMKTIQAAKQQQQSQGSGPKAGVEPGRSSGAPPEAQANVIGA